MGDWGGPTTAEMADAAIRRQAALLDHAYDAIFTWDWDGPITFWNRGAERLYGYAKEEAVGRVSHELLRTGHPEALATMLIALERDGAWEGELEHTRRDGTQVVVETRNGLVRGEGRPYVVEVNRDATGRKRAEERLRFLAEAGTVLAASLDPETTLTGVARLVVPRLADWCAVHLVGEDGRVLQLGVAHADPEKLAWARALQERFPYDPDAAHGVAAVLRSGTPQLYPEIPDALLEAGARNAEHLAILRAVGMSSAMIVPLATRGRTLGAITLVAAESGRRYGADDAAFAEELARRCALAVDNARLFREAQESEARVRELNAELEQRVAERTAQLTAANRELEAFSYSVSHDLRAPLRAIDGFSRILLEDYAADLPEEGRRYLHIVRDGTAQMGRLIDDLLAFARLGRQPLRTQTVLPASIVAAVLDDLRGEVEGRPVELIVEDLPACRADPALLKQIYANLLANALKYTRGRDPATVRVGAVEDDGAPGERTYFVRDNGVGFDMAYAPKLFGVFQRLHRAEEYEGTGVGLAVVQRIVHRHGGRVWAEAEPDRGATFWFTLPAAVSDDVSGDGAEEPAG